MKPVREAWVVTLDRGTRRESRIGAAFPSSDGTLFVELDAIPRDGRFELRETRDEALRRTLHRDPWGAPYSFQTSPRAHREATNRRSSWLDGLADDPFAGMDVFDFGLDGEWPAPPGAPKVEPRSGPWVGPARPWPEETADSGQRTARSRSPEPGARSPKAAPRGKR